MFGIKNTIRKSMFAAVTTLGVATASMPAFGFCFTSDSLSNASFTVEQLDKSKFFNSISSALNKTCKGASRGEAKTCKEVSSRMAEGFKQAAQDLKKGKVTGPAILVLEGSAEAAYDLLTGIPLAGDSVDIASNFTRNVGKGISGGARAVASAIDGLISKRFKQTVKTDQTKCCSYKNKDCNPSGKRDATIYFKIKHGKEIRTVAVGAQDHMICRIDKRHPKRSVCRNYEYPNETPPLYNKDVAARGVLLKGYQNRCLDASKSQLKANAEFVKVALWKCHGGKNQRWNILKNGLIRNAQRPACLEAGSVRNGKGKNDIKIRLGGCHGGKNQRWQLNTHNNTLQVQMPGSDRFCLAVGADKNKKGAPVRTWKCNSKWAHHRWYAKKK